MTENEIKAVRLRQEKDIARLFAKFDASGVFYTEIDGFVVFSPIAGQGCYSAWVLRAIAEELDRRNAEYAAVIEAYFRDN